ncbi:TB2/DP1, HVA22 family domain-containing protein [Ditylenchus destructor]|uniref:TB2/DP1, HVA22 family domain-containing protein n=1 Tax=Ditylenchus destructor TaxID=166010 RepID=A0AAD4N8C1_9BILA|nr:TB2/DP1, HVA22 family domain-containing protein [Ditylenchus destructor]
MRRDAENFWMHQLVTIYPFGMNDKVDGMDGFATDMNCAKKRNFKHYFSNPLPNVKRRTKFTVNNSTSTNKLTEAIQKETPENYEIRDMYQMFRSYKNMETTKLLKEVENTNKDKESLLASKLLAIIKLNRKKHIVTTEKIPIFIKVDFLNSVMEKLGIRNMIHDSKIERMLHLKESNYKVNLVYNLVKNNFLRFSNYNNTLKNLTQNQLVRIMNEECECKNSPEFVDTQYGHIITDFSNLFTSLPHEDIIDAIMYLTTRTFEAQNGKKEIHCNQYRAFFSHQYHKNYTPYTLYEVKYMVEFLIKNSYVRFADRNFVQIKGVPQGGNASPLLADLMLTAMEIKYLGTCDNLVKRELSVSFRYIDDLFSLNENIKNHTAAIYGNVLELNRTDNQNGTAFLDLDIKLCNGKIEIKTYDKTRDFRFESRTRNSSIAMDSTGTAQDATIVDPTRSSAAHDTVEQPMEEVEDDNVNDIALNANRRASLTDPGAEDDTTLQHTRGITATRPRDIMVAIKNSPEKDENGVDAALPSFRDIFSQFLKQQPENSVFGKVLSELEKRTKLNRDQIGYVGAVLLALYLGFGQFAQVVCNLIGFAYPTYCSVKAIRSEGKNDDTRWLMYWTVFAFFTLVDNWLVLIVPFYWLFKTPFLLYLASPNTSGAEILYNHIVSPAVSKFDQYLENKTHDQ